MPALHLPSWSHVYDTKQGRFQGLQGFILTIATSRNTNQGPHVAEHLEIRVWSRASGSQSSPWRWTNPATHSQQLFLSLFTMTILVNQRCSLLLWFDKVLVTDTSTYRLLSYLVGEAWQNCSGRRFWVNFEFEMQKGSLGNKISKQNQKSSKPRQLHELPLEEA